MKPFSKKTNEEIYLEYVNDWLTLESMADNYGRDTKYLERIIKKGKKEHDTKSNTPLKIMKTTFIFSVHKRNEFGDHIPTEMISVKVKRVKLKSAREFIYNKYPNNKYFVELDSTINHK